MRLQPLLEQRPHHLSHRRLRLHMPHKQGTRLLHPRHLVDSERATGISIPVRGREGVREELLRRDARLGLDGAEVETFVGEGHRARVPRERCRCRSVRHAFIAEQCRRDTLCLARRRGGRRIAPGAGGGVVGVDLDVGHVDEGVGVEVRGIWWRYGEGAVAHAGAGAGVVGVCARCIVLAVHLARFLGFVCAGLLVWPLFLGTAALGLVFFALLETWEGADAHATLAVTGKCIMAGELGAAGTFVWSVVFVDGGMSLHVVLADESLAAVVALELTIA